MKLVDLFLVAFFIVAAGCSSSPDKEQPQGQIPEDVCNDVSSVDSAGAAVVDDSVDESVDTMHSDSDEQEVSPITWSDCSGIPGDKACDFTFKDQNGDDWSLYDNYGTVMVIDFSTVWCGVCKSIAGDVQAHQDAYTSRGHDFLWVTVLVDGVSWGTPPEATDIQSWATTYGITSSPVLVGDRSVIDLSAQDGYPISAWPTLVVVDDTLTVHNGILGWNESTVFGWVDEALGISR